MVEGWSGPWLAANLAVWCALFGGLAIASQWLLRRYGPHGRYRRRLIALSVLLVVAATIVFVNLHGGDPGVLQPRVPYGWPFIWRWHNVWNANGVIVLDQNYSAVRLAYNLAMWLALLAAPGITSEWLLRRFRPRLRWSLRTMLGVVGVAAVLCAWCAALYHQASVQDPIIAAANDHSVILYWEHWGPQWLSLMGADRFRRRIVGADVVDNHGRGESFLKLFRRLRSLRYLTLMEWQPTPGVAAALGELFQVRILLFRNEAHDNELSQECLAAIGKLTQLEDLHLQLPVESSNLSHLAGLTNLKSLSLYFNRSDESEANIGMQGNVHLPALPRLEAVELGSSFAGGTTVDDEDLRQLAVIPRLTSLNVNSVQVTDEGLAQLALFKSLEELAICEDVMSPARLKTLLALKRLKALHVRRWPDVTDEMLAELPNQESIQERATAPFGAFEADDMADEEAMADEDEDEEATSNEETTSEDETMSNQAAMLKRKALSPTEVQLWQALSYIRELHVRQHGFCDESDRLTTLALDHGDRVFVFASDVDALGRAFDALRQANPGIVIDTDARWSSPHRGLKRAPFVYLGGP